MAFLESNSIRTALTPSVLNRCNTFSCANEDLDSFFSRDAVKYSQQLMGKKKQIGKNLPWEKRDLIYPAVLIGRLGVGVPFKKLKLQELILFYSPFKYSSTFK